MDRIITNFCQGLYGAASVAEQYFQIEHWAAAGETELLLRLAVALEGREWDDAVKPWAIEAVLNHIEVALALTPGLQQAEALLRLSLLTRRATVQARSVSQLQRYLTRRPRLLASMLASAQGLDVLAELFARFAHREEYAEILMLLAQEMVLRRMACEEIPALVGHNRKILSRDHPLGRLPLTLTEIEADVSLPSYHMSGGTWTLPFGPTEESAGRSRAMERTVPQAITETTAESEQHQSASAVAEWAQSSNGRFEIRTFTVDAPLLQEQLGSTLLVSLDLECLRGAGENEIRVESISSRRAFNLLFAASSLGGAYPSGHCGAYGRYEAWRSLAGLAGAAEGESIDRLLARARQCEWLYFEAQTKWFYQVAWDLGLVVLRPDRKSLAVIAATDTD